MKSTALQRVDLEIGDVVRTVLPIEFSGRDLLLEARGYQGADPTHQAMALIHRSKTVADGTIPLVRVHSGCVTGDIFHSLRCDCYQQLQAALHHVTEAPLGVIIYLPYHEGRGIGLYNKLKAYALQDQGLDTIEANVEIGEPVDSRDYTLAAEILRDLDMPVIQLMSNNPAKMAALAALGITVAARVPIVVQPSIYNRRYLDTKRARMAHKF